MFSSITLSHIYLGDLVPLPANAEPNAEENTHIFSQRISFPSSPFFKSRICEIDLKMFAAIL